MCVSGWACLWVKSLPLLQRGSNRNISDWARVCPRQGSDAPTLSARIRATMPCSARRPFNSSFVPEPAACRLHSATHRDPRGEGQCGIRLNPQDSDPPSHLSLFIPRPSVLCSLTFSTMKRSSLCPTVPHSARSETSLSLLLFLTLSLSLSLFIFLSLCLFNLLFFLSHLI